MGVSISFKCTLDNEGKIDSEFLEEKLNQLNIIYDFKLNNIDSRKALVFYNLGVLFIRVDERKVVGDVRTFEVGPGFHHFILNFINEFAAILGYNLEINDDSFYNKNKDFEKLLNYFIEKLKVDLLEIKEFKTTDKYYFGFDWLPNVDNALVTNLGPINFEDIKEDADFFALARKFFLWFNIEKDAYFYRNLVYYYIWSIYHWVKPRTEAEDKIIEEILEYSNFARSLDKEIALPNAELEIIKSSLGSFSERVDSKSLIGYKRGNIIYPINSRWKISVAGFYDSDYEDEFRVFYDKDHYIKIKTVYRNKEQSFNENLQGSENERVIEFEKAGYRYLGIYFKDTTSNLWVLKGEILTEESISEVWIYSKGHYDYEWVYSTFTNLEPKIEVYNYFSLAYLDYGVKFLENGLFIYEARTLIPYEDIDFKVFVDNYKNLSFIMYFKEGYPLETGVINISWDLEQWIKKYELKVMDIELFSLSLEEEHAKGQKFFMSASGFSVPDKVVLTVLIVTIYALSALIFLGSLLFGLIFFGLVNIFLFVLFYHSYTKRLKITNNGVLEKSNYAHAKKKAYIPFSKIIKVEVSGKKISVLSKNSNIEFSNRKSILKTLKKHIDNSLIEYK
ncbi:MAG: hypothetical protein WC006_00385 [Bacilli bacterium]|nr:EbsA family protein [Bacilli bacterium]